MCPLKGCQEIYLVAAVFLAEPGSCLCGCLLQTGQKPSLDRRKGEIKSQNYKFCKKWLHTLHLATAKLLYQHYLLQQIDTYASDKDKTDDKYHLMLW